MQNLYSSLKMLLPLILLIVFGKLAAAELDVAVEAKVSAFFPASSVTKRIYRNVLPLYELEIAQRFCCNWQVWLGAGYLSAKGHSLGCPSKSTLQFIPCTLGVKYLYQITPCLETYIGGGLCWSFIKINDHSPYVHKPISKQALGGIAKIGLLYDVTECIFLDFFAEYLYQQFTYNHYDEEHYTVPHNFSMRGCKIGAGIGINF